MRTNESGLRRIARRSATLVKLQVRKRQKPAHARRLAAGRAVRALPGLVRARLHRARAGGGRADRRAAGPRRPQLVSLVVSC